MPSLHLVLHADLDMARPKSTVLLPENAVAVYAEVYASGNGQEEFWVCALPCSVPLVLTEKSVL